MNEISLSIYSTLSAATALTSLLAGTASIYHIQAPDNATLPYVVFSTQAGGDENQTPIRRKNIVLFVRGYSAVSAAAAGSIDAQIDTLLHGKSLTITGWNNFWLAREQDLENIDNQSSTEKVWMAGGLYRARFGKTS